MTRSLAVFASLVVVAFAEKLPLPDGGSVELPTTSNEESKAFWEKEHQEREAAIQRLPDFDERRMEAILSILREVKYPVSFDVLKAMLGGPDAMVWCCDHGKLEQSYRKQTSTFTVARMPPGGGSYVLVVDFEDSLIDQAPTFVSRARLCYESPFGWRFVAESMEDRLAVGSGEKEPNPAPQRNGGSRPSSGDSSASETPSSPGPHGCSGLSHQFPL